MVKPLTLSRPEYENHKWWHFIYGNYTIHQAITSPFHTTHIPYIISYKVCKKCREQVTAINFNGYL